MKILNKYFLMLFALSVTLVACNDDDEDNNPQVNNGPTQNIAEIASSSDDYSILVEALSAANLVDAVSDPMATLTVFAPNNQAFNTLFDQLQLMDDNGDGSRVDELVDALGAEAVTNILLYHVLGAEIQAADVPEKAYVTTISTGSPGENQLSLLVESRSNGVFLNNTTQVNAPNIFATNGVIHGIDAVLLLPTVVDHAINNPGDLSILTGAVVDAGLADDLSGEGPFTVFAPVNSAFEAISSTVDGLTPEQLVTVLQYHVVEGQVREAQVSTGSVPTLSTQEIGITVTAEGGVVISDADDSNTDAVVVLTDVQATNGVVHVINAVLIPQL